MLQLETQKFRSAKRRLALMIPPSQRKPKLLILKKEKKPNPKRKELLYVCGFH